MQNKVSFCSYSQYQYMLPLTSFTLTIPTRQTAQPNFLLYTHILNILMEFCNPTLFLVTIKFLLGTQVDIPFFNREINVYQFIDRNYCLLAYRSKVLTKGISLPTGIEQVFHF